MIDFGFSLVETVRPTIGLIALQSDETIEDDFRRLFRDVDVSFLVSRVPSSEEVSTETLGRMAEHLTDAASLFPRATKFSAVGYGCTSGTSVIGADRVGELVEAGCDTRHVSEPVSALLDWCCRNKAGKLAFLSPYVETVSDRLRETLGEAGVSTDVFESFNEPAEERVVRIDSDSIIAAACNLANGGDVDAIFLSCTNLRTLDAIPEIEKRTGLRTVSSNLVLAEHLAILAGTRMPGLR